MTPQQFADSLITPNKQVGFNQADFGQCVAVPELWWEAHKLPFLVGNAIDLSKAADPKYFEVYSYVPSFQAQPGDVIIWGEDALIGTGVYGHTDLYIKDLGNGAFQGLDQNWPIGSPPHYVTHTWEGVKYIIRIKQEYLIQVMDKADVIAYYWNSLHRVYPQQVSDAEINGLIGKKLSDVAAQERTSPQWLHQNDLVLNGDQRIQQINDLNAKIQALQSTPTEQQITQLKQEVADLTGTINQLESKQPSQ